MAELPDVDFSAVRKLDAGAVQLLWVNDWYDGPLEAVVEHEGQVCLLVLHDKRALSDEERPLRWIVLGLTPEQIRKEEQWHALFAQHVGEHWCTHGEPHAFAEGPQDPELFYRHLRAHPPRDLSKSEVHGWLDELPRA